MKKIYILSFFIVSSWLAKGQTTNYQVHSLFIMNIAKYSTWPAVTGAEFQIAVFGKSKIYEELVKQMTGKNINGHPIKVFQVENVAELSAYQLIFVADGKSAALDEILKSTEGKPAMIVAEREGLYKKGAGFSFVLMDDNTLRFDINQAALDKKQIKVSKNLANLAHTII
jgi:hypothetical protein